MPRVPDWFVPSILFQQASTELVVFSPTVKQFVTVAWYVLHSNAFYCPSNVPPEHLQSRPTRNGNRIQDGQLREWLRRRGLHLSCFCPLVSDTGQSASCQIVHCRGGSVKAFCTEFPPKCGFYSEFQ